MLMEKADFGGNLSRVGAFRNWSTDGEHPPIYFQISSSNIRYSRYPPSVAMEL